MDTVLVMLTVLVTVTVSVTTVTTPQPSKLEPFTLTDGLMDPITESDLLSTLLAKGRLRLKLTPLFCMLVPMEVTMEVFMEVTVTDTVSVTLTVSVTVTVLVTTVTTPEPSKLEPFTLTDGPMDPTTELDPLSTLLAKGRQRPRLTPLFCTLVPIEVTVTDTVLVTLTVLVTVTVSVTTVTTPELSKLEPFTLTDGPMDPTTESDPLSTLLAKGRLRLKLTPLFCTLVPMEVTMVVFMEV